jgi:hypothetical protein
VNAATPRERERARPGIVGRRAAGNRDRERAAPDHVNAAAPQHRAPGFAGIFVIVSDHPSRSPPGEAGSRIPAESGFTLHESRRSRFTISDLAGEAGVHDARRSRFTPTCSLGAAGVHDHQRPRRCTWRRHGTLVQASCAAAAPNATRPLDVSVEGPDLQAQLRRQFWRGYGRACLTNKRGDPGLNLSSNLKSTSRAYHSPVFEYALAK